MFMKDLCMAKKRAISLEKLYKQCIYWTNMVNVVFFFLFFTKREAKKTQLLSFYTGLTQLWECSMYSNVQNIRYNNI